MKVQFLNIVPPHGPTKDGLERRNPLIVAIGDSVTAGHFEFIIPIEELVKDLKAPNGPVDVTDSRESYVEKFRYKLIDKFETTSVSIINSGIGGDNIIGINKRIDRDVLSHNPDLVIINASLNLPEECGDTLAYKKELLKAIKEIKEKNISGNCINDIKYGITRTVFQTRYQNFLEKEQK